MQRLLAIMGGLIVGLGFGLAVNAITGPHYDERKAFDGGNVHLHAP